MSDHISITKRLKLEILNYKLRMYCKKEQIDKPRIFFMFPSLYPESITIDNLDILFHFLHYEELEFNKTQIKVALIEKIQVDFLTL